MPVIATVGGLPGAGKSTVSRQAASELSLPLVASDTLGRAAVRGAGATSARVSSSDCFRIGYDVLFAIVDEYASVGLDVLVEMSMGWQFQWDRLNEIADKRRASSVVLFLDASVETCSANASVDSRPLRSMTRLVRTVAIPA